MIDRERKPWDKPTPGPWRVHGRLVFAGDLLVARCSQNHPPRYEAPQHWTQEANARLIAAAPDLLEAARAILFQVVQGAVLERDACISALRAAIAKAEGRS